MDNVIDKLILEWSWRCEKGYPDVNNPADKKVLDKLLAEYGVSLATFKREQKEQPTSLLNENLQNIKNLLSTGEYDEKFLSRIERMLQDYEEVRELKQLLAKNGITKNTFPDRDLPDEIISILQRGPKSDVIDFVNHLKSRQTPSLKLSPGKHNIYETFPEGLLNKLASLGKITGQSSSVAIGRGEIFFPLAFNNVRLKKDNETGDLQVDGKNVELKALGVTKEGKPSKSGARFGESRSGVTYQPINEPVEKNPRIANQIYNDFEASKKVGNTEKVLSNVKEYIKRVYDIDASILVPKNEIDVVNTLYEILISIYARQKNIDYFLLYAPLSGDYAVYTPKQLIQSIQNGEVEVTTITNTSAIPQLKSFK